MPEPDRSELTSWKMIADYLNVTVRTAQTWEKSRGLPVRRTPGQRGRVYALPGELDTWRGESDPSALGEPAEIVPKRRLRWAATLGVIVVLGGLLMAWQRTLPGGPASYQLTDTHVVVFGENGRELWRKVAEFSRGLYGQKGLIRIQDLDGDGVNEVLLVEKEAEQYAARLVCYGADGTRKWAHRPQGKVRTRLEEFSDSYGIHSVELIQMEGQWRVFVAAHHTTFYPGQVIALSGDGSVLQRYWHSGHFTDLLAADRNRDGRPELYAGGVSNSWKRGTVVRLDPGKLGGASVEAEHPDYQLVGFSAGTELGRVILPRTCRSPDPLVVVWDLRLSGGDLIATLMTAPVTEPFSEIFFNIGMDLLPRTVGLSSHFVQSHAAGNHEWSKQEEERLLADVVRLK